jgi:hypothetical protein
MKTKNNSNAYVQLPRSMFQHMFWTQERTFSRAEAWIDLVQMAAYKEQPVMVGVCTVTVKRGELVASARYLSIRWRWSNGKVLRFLGFLEDEGLISRRMEYGQTIVCIGQYDLHQKIDAKMEHQTDIPAMPQDPMQERLSAPQAQTNGTPDECTHGTLTEHQRNKYNKEKKEKKEKEADAHALGRLMEWMQEYTPNVLLLPDQLSPQQYTALLTAMDATRMRSLLVAMQHYAPLAARYRSVYYALLRFAAQDTKPKPHTATTLAHEDTATLSPASQQLKAAISRRQQRCERG